MHYLKMREPFLNEITEILIYLMVGVLPGVDDVCTVLTLKIDYSRLRS